MSRTSSKTNLRVDWFRKELGRINKTSGTRLKKEYRKRLHMLDGLYERGRFDLLEAIREGKYSVTEVYAYYPDRLDELTHRRVLMLPFWATAEAWAGDAHPNSTRGRHWIALKQLRGLDVIPTNAKIQYLADVDWHDVKRRFPYSASSYNHVRKAISKFLSDQFQDVDAKFRRALFKKNKKDEIPFPKATEPPHVPDWTPAVFLELISYLPDYIRPSIMLLVVTGMRTGEYLALRDHHLKHHTCMIMVPGTKSKESANPIKVSERMWPWIEAAVPSPVQYKWLRIHFKRAATRVGQPELRLHDLRHAYAQFLIAAGRPEISVQQGLRHSSPDMTRLYARMKSQGEDAEMMADLLLNAKSA